MLVCGLAKPAHNLFTRGKWVGCAMICSQMVICYASSTSSPPIVGDEEVPMWLARRFAPVGYGGYVIGQMRNNLRKEETNCM